MLNVNARNIKLAAGVGALACVGFLFINHVKDAGPKPYNDSEIVGFINHDLAKIYTFDTAEGLDKHMENVQAYMTDEGADGLRSAFQAARVFESGNIRQEVADLRSPVVEAVQESGEWEWHYTTSLKLRQRTTEGKEYFHAWNVEGFVKPKKDDANYLGFDNIISYPAE